MIEEERAYRVSDHFDRDRRYWTDSLTGLPERPTTFSDRPAPRTQGFVRRSAFVPPSTIDGLLAAGKQVGASLGQLAIAAAAVLVHRVTGEDDIVLDVPVTARITPLSRRTPGMLANTLPVRFAVRPDMAVAELVGKTVHKLVRRCGTSAMTFQICGESSGASPAAGGCLARQ